MAAVRDKGSSPVGRYDIPTWNLLMRGISKPRWIVLTAAAFAGASLLYVDQLIRSDAHLLFGFFVIVVGVTWTGHAFEAVVAEALLLGSWIIDMSASGESGTSLMLLGLLSGAMLLTLGVLVTRVFRRLILEMSDAARRDSLTGLLNTRAFQEIAERERIRATRTGLPISVAFLDLDQFKQVNDAHGHVVGDAVLSTFGEVIRTSIRATDVVGRAGGDEFILLLPETDQFEATAVLQRIRHRATLRTDIPLVTATAGYVTFTTPPATVEEMTRAADELMYKAKRRGNPGVLIGKVAGAQLRSRSPVCPVRTIDITDKVGRSPLTPVAIPTVNVLNGHTPAADTGT